MLKNGWIRIDKKIIDWEWYTDSNTFHLFLHLLLTCNYEKKKWRGMIIEPGQRVITFRKLAKEIGLSLQQIRTCFDRLKSTHSLTQRSTHQYTLITICNYKDYQLSENTKQHSVQHTQQHSINTYVTNSIIKEHNTITNKEKIYKKEKYSDDFETFWGYYPKGLASYNKQLTFTQWLGRLKEGDKAEEMIFGVIGYQKYCVATNKIGSDYIKLPSTFIGKKKHFRGYINWRKENGKRDNKSKSISELSKQFVRA